ncbi:MAG: nucleotidyltransferase [bacterium]|nr:nucleotidyltransferase [bacterium]
MKLEDIKEENLLFKCIAGSKAYGLDTPESDTDIKGVFLLSREEYYGLEYYGQLNNESNDIVYYELRRFVELLYKNNPGILEMLAIPEKCILYKHPLFDRFQPKMFLSKQCKNTFAGYALAQVKRAKGLNKKIMNPIPEERLGVLNFCYVIEGQGSVPLTEWLESNNMKQEYCGLVNIPHMKDIYGLFYDKKAAETKGKETRGMRGIVKTKEAEGVLTSRVPKGLKPSGTMAYNKQAYSKYCRDYKDYWDWVAKRNDARYKDTISHGKNYDAKNMMHTFRLLDMAEEIARCGKIVVKRENREELLDIKRGTFMYDSLVEKAETKIKIIESLYEMSHLQDYPDKTKIDHLLIQTRKEFYI